MRFTARYDELDPFSCLYAVMHETGHALYEQGLDENHRFTPEARYLLVSMNPNAALGESNRSCIHSGTS